MIELETLRVIVVDNSPYRFHEVIIRGDPEYKTWSGRFRAVIEPWTTVLAPVELAKHFPAKLTSRDGRPVWRYKLVDGTVYALHPVSPSFLGWS